MTKDEIDEAKALLNEHWPKCKTEEELPRRLTKLFNKASPEETEFLGHYLTCLLEGCSPTLADMLASQSPPTGHTDATFMAGNWDGGIAVPRVREAYKRMAAACGVKAEGKRYYNRLARFPGDPLAWVDGKGGIASVCKMRGWGAPELGLELRQEIKKIPKRKAGNIKARLQKAGLPSRVE